MYLSREKGGREIKCLKDVYKEIRLVRKPMDTGSVEKRVTERGKGPANICWS